MTDWKAQEDKYLINVMNSSAYDITDNVKQECLEEIRRRLDNRRDLMRRLRHAMRLVDILSSASQFPIDPKYIQTIKDMTWEIGDD